MSEDYPASSDGGSDDGGYGLMDDKDEKELMVECGQRQVRQDWPAAATMTQCTKTSTSPVGSSHSTVVMELALCH